ncbi:MAG: VCBS repeat-containing protein [Bacteroidota bacterium]
MKNYYLSLFLFLLLGLISCSPQEEPTDLLFQTLPGNQLGIDFQNTIKDSPQLNILQYLYFYNGAGLGAGYFNGDSLIDLYFVSNREDNGLYLQKEGLQFHNATAEARLPGKAAWQTGISVVDINHDGWDDLYICAVTGLPGFTGHNELYINQQDGTFREAAAEYGLDIKGFCTQAYFFDYDRDDDLDVFIVKHATHTETSHGPASRRQERNALTGDQLLENREGRFVDVSEAAGIYGGMNGYGLSASIFDANADGWMDIYVCNDFHENDYLYINQQNGRFEEQIADYFTQVSRFSMGSDAADINNDGYPDLMTLDMLPEEEYLVKASDPGVNYQVDSYLRNLGYYPQFSRNMLQINQQGQAFNEVAFRSRVEASDWSWAPLFADFNNDQQLDLFISNGIIKRPNDLDFINFTSNAKRSANLMPFIEAMPTGKVANKIYEGEAGVSFWDRKGKWMRSEPSLSNGAIYVDLDNDGRLDVVTNNINAAPTIYRNQGEGKKSLAVQLKYKGENPAGIGAELHLYSAGQRQYRQLNPFRGFLSSVDRRCFFGLEQLASVDSIVVYWPDGSRQRFDQLPERGAVELVYAAQPAAATADDRLRSEAVADAGLIDYTHQENAYEDFEAQKLLPYRLSASGPKAAQADVNGDGRSDVAICGSAGTPSVLYLQTADGHFRLAADFFAGEARYEDTDLAFFDADGDGDQDLLFASGGGIFDCQSPLLGARLYRNDGRGQFELAEAYAFPTPVNFSCIAVTDMDQDGDTDVFLGARAACQAWGRRPNAYLLRNEGGGQLQPVAAPELQALGFVTDASWLDLNGDQFPELLLTAEWSPPILLPNQAGELQAPQPLADSLSGLWQTLLVTDLQEDGQPEVLLGNWGLNNKFASRNRLPLRAWQNDFDANGAEEFIVGYSLNGKVYPLNTRDELRQSQTGVFTKKFTSYSSYANKTIPEVFASAQLKESEQFEVRELRSGYLQWTEEGSYQFVAFPEALQRSPLHFFLPIKENKSFIAAGNKYDLQPYHGILSADPMLLTVQPAGELLALQTSWLSRKGHRNGQFTAGLCISQSESTQLVLLFLNNGKARSIRLLKE